MAYGTLGFSISYVAVLAECKSLLISAGSTHAALLSFFLVSEYSLMSQHILYPDCHNTLKNFPQGIKTTFGN